MAGTSAQPIGITDPPIDELLEQVDSKYALVIYAAKRARQLNTYNQQLQEGLLEFVGPLVPAAQEDKPLSIALREINAGQLTLTRAELETVAARVDAQDEAAAPSLEAPETADDPQELVESETLE